MKFSVFCVLYTLWSMNVEALKGRPDLSLMAALLVRCSDVTVHLRLTQLRLHTAAAVVIRHSTGA